VLTPRTARGRGWLAEYFDNADFKGEPKLRRVEPRVYYDANMRSGRGCGVNGNKYAIRWRYAVPPAGKLRDSAHTVSGTAGKITLFLDDKEVNPEARRDVRRIGPRTGPGTVSLGSARSSWKAGASTSED